MCAHPRGERLPSLCSYWANSFTPDLSGIAGREGALGMPFFVTG